MSQKKNKALRKQQKIQVAIPINVVDNNLGFFKKIKDNWKFLVVLCLGIIALYWNSLHGAFVSDDYASIPQNPLITNFSVGVGGLLVGISNWLIAVIFGTVNPFYYHLLSLLFYLLTCLVAFVLVSIIFNEIIAKYTLIIFAVLPVHVEAVTWISGKPYLFNAFFVLLSLTIFVLFLKTDNKKYLYYLLALLPLTFFAEKVRSTALLLLAFLYFISFETNYRKKISLSKFFIIFSLLLIFSGIILRSQIINRVQIVNSGYNFSGDVFYDPFFQYPTAIAKYLQLIFIPTDLTLYHTMFVLPIWLNWAILINYLILVVYFYFKDKRYFFVLAFIFVATAPSMAPIKVSWLVAERYVFLGSLGFCLLLALLLDSFKKNKTLLLSVFTIFLLLPYTVLTFLRNIDWQTNHNLWVKTVQTSPNSHNAWNNIGDDYDKLKQYDNAIKGFSQSTIVKPDYADAYHNRANIFYKTGRLDLAIDSYETALKYSPTLYQTHTSLVQIGLMMKDYKLAIDHAKKLIEIQNNNPTSYYIYGIVMLQTEQIDEAKNAMETALKIYPEYKQAKDVLVQLKQSTIPETQR